MLSGIGGSGICYQESHRDVALHDYPKGNMSVRLQCTRLSVAHVLPFASFLSTAYVVLNISKNRQHPMATELEF